MIERHIDINRFDYDLPDGRIAKFPLPERSSSKLLVYRGGEISEAHFADMGDVLPEGQLLVFNNTKVIRARIIMHKPSGARIEVFCLEPHDPADYERAFAVTGTCQWSCIVGNLKKWKEGYVEINFEHEGRPEHLRAWIAENRGREHTVRFEWSAAMTFGQLLEYLGRIPIPPYLNRESELIDYTRYQTVYSKFEGSVAAPTAGLHFTPELIEGMKARGFGFEEVTLHVGAGTFLPVKDEETPRGIRCTPSISRCAVRRWPACWRSEAITAVGTTSCVLWNRLRLLAWGASASAGTLDAGRVVGQWELYDIPAEFSGREALQEVVGVYGARGAGPAESLDADYDHAAGLRVPHRAQYRHHFHQPKSTRCCCWFRPLWATGGGGFTTTPSPRLPLFELRRFVGAAAGMTVYAERKRDARRGRPFYRRRRIRNCIRR
ncbi:MAG: S-adenosylmethionine:tRNA ribosyltransferase-isomerase [Alistipes sp.]